MIGFLLLNNPRMFGFCYTQLYDVEQECNGIYDYHRRPKVDIATIRAINTAPAAIETIGETAEVTSSSRQEQPCASE